MVMTAAAERFRDGELMERVIGGFFAVYNALRPGMLEVVYRRAMIAELQHLGLTAETEVPYQVVYRGQVVGSYRADLVVEKRVIVECKAVEQLLAIHNAQLLNYLSVANVKLGLLLNFGPAAKVRRFERGFTRNRSPVILGNPR